jgi:cytochrome c oxidase assembly factor CtaG
MRTKDILLTLIVIPLIVLFSFPLNDWLSATMPRHQIIQLPIMFLLGLLLGLNFSSLNIKKTSWGIAVLIFIMASFIFWMLPHSIDAAVINKASNRLMHLNMLIAGFLLMPVLRNALFEIKILFLGMLSAMMLATGITLRAFNILLCSSFTIDEQKETGFYLIIVGFLLFVLTFITFFKASGEKKELL